MKKRIANLTSNVLHPFLLILALILLLSFTATSGMLDAVKWTAISIAISVLPVLLFVIYLVRSGKVDAVFTNDRQQRTKIYLLAGLCSFASCFILASLGAPSILVTAYSAGLAVVVIFMFINLWWKISLHTALISAAVTIMIMLYGGMATVTVVLVPLTAWSRIELKYHSLAQAVTGALLAALIVVMTFSLVLV